MGVKDKPTTPIPGHFLGVVLLIVGGIFIGHFVWTIGAFSAPLGTASLSKLLVMIGGVLGGALLVGIGMAAILHTAGKLSIGTDIDWDI